MKATQALKKKLPYVEQSKAQAVKTLQDILRRQSSTEGVSDVGGEGFKEETLCGVVAGREDIGAVSMRIFVSGILDAEIYSDNKCY